MARVQVRDNGIGVPPEQRERIFEDFHRATAETTGTGLGLAICQRIVERHGGTISVDGQPRRRQLLRASRCRRRPTPFTAANT